MLRPLVHVGDDRKTSSRETTEIRRFPPDESGSLVPVLTLFHSGSVKMKLILATCEFVEAWYNGDENARVKYNGSDRNMLIQRGWLTITAI